MKLSAADKKFMYFLYFYSVYIALILPTRGRRRYDSASSFAGARGEKAKKRIPRAARLKRSLESRFCPRLISVDLSGRETERVSHVKLITWPGGSGSAFVSNDLQVYRRRHALPNDHTVDTTAA